MTQQLAHIDGVSVDFDTTFAQMTTLRIGGRPRAWLKCASAQAAAAVVGELDAKAIPVVIVGGGSNLVVADGEVDVVAVSLEFDRLDIDEATGKVFVEAGAVWDDVVAASVAAGLGGIECLSGIPGSAGAVPVQNVGAYGAEVSDVLTRVQLFNRETRAIEWVPVADLELAYRYSNLKFTGRAVVLGLEMQLRTDGLSKPLRFGQLTQVPGERRPVAQVREQVLGLRRSKGMVLEADDHDTWSAGSFFTNPVVSPALADAVCRTVARTRGEADAQGMPRHPARAADGTAAEKLSAAWLIERAGFAKGYPGSGPARLSSKHTLALTNRGGAGAADIVSLARDIRDGVERAFGVRLVPEPVWLGVEI